MRVKSAASVLVLGWLAFHLGGATPASKALDQLESSVRRPLPAVPQPEVQRPDRVWVPDRYIDRPGGIAHVPGHWEQRISDHEVLAPPLTVCDTGGRCTLVPAGVRPPADVRRGP